MDDYLVSVDQYGYYFDPNTGEAVSVVFDDNGLPYDADLNVPLRFWGDSGFDGAQITSAVRDVLISVYGNPAAVRANAPRDRVPINQVPAQQQAIITSTLRPSRGSDGAGIHLSTTTLMLIVGGVLLFMVGQNRGASRR